MKRHFPNVSSTERTSDKQTATKAHRVDLDISDNRSSDGENGKAYYSSQFCHV